LEKQYMREQIRRAGRERRLNGIGRAQMDPMFGAEIVEGK
jgi:hypothetical protein